MNAAVEIKDLLKLFNGEKILNHLNLNIEIGKITTILGFSGSGKTTLLKHILGLIKPTSGEVFVFQKNIFTMKDKALRDFRQNFGMLFQGAGLFDSLTAFENIAFPLREFTKMTEKEIFIKVNVLLNSVKIEPSSIYKLPSELSGGMRKRVGFARALALNPKIMIYDEPTTGLDPLTTKIVNDLILETALKYKEERMTSIIISHDVKATIEISDYIAFLDRGIILENFLVKDFLNTKNPIIRKFLEI